MDGIKLYDGIALVNQKLGKFKESIDNSKSSIRLKEIIKDKSGLGKSLTNLASTYIKKGEFSKSTICLEKALVIQNEIKNVSIETTNRFILVYPSLKKWPCLDHINNHRPESKYTCYYQ